jgi:hypothetical protein
MSESDCVKTVGGELAVIYNRDGGGAFPIHGAVWNRQCKCWEPMQWRVNGLAISHRISDNLVLTHWQDEIPWECLRDEIKWVAEDPDGIWFGYFQKPKLEELGWGSDYPQYDLTCIEMPERSKDWKNSLAKRPEGR